MAADLLLDTHAALWWWRDIPKLSAAALAAIESAPKVRVSVASAYEIAQKWRLGKLSMIDDPALHFPAMMTENGFDAFDLTTAHTLAAGLLPGEHRDPFDRLIAAQALALDATVITRDPAFAAFGCKVLW